MVAEGRSGHLVEAGDEAGFAEAIDRLLASREERRTMGEVGQAIAARDYSVERMCQETEQLLLGLLARRT
jgi:glycosyltransferase involved in cell wall biosynthesis